MDKLINLLKKGGVAVIPTDTVYGIVGSALNKKTVKEIYKLRKRSKTKPFIILISSLNDLKIFDVSLTKVQTEFLKEVWPNPLSVVLHNLAFRIPKDKWLMNLLKKAGPLVAPSANIEGENPAENIEDARKYFHEKVDFYLDKGRINSQPSTLIELEKDGSYKILREGKFKL